MDFILNEKSLHGQFESTEEFLESLSENISCFQLVSKNMVLKQIMKFRINDKMRCFGYRKKDYFRLLRIERDHKISNKG